METAEICPGCRKALAESFAYAIKSVVEDSTVTYINYKGETEKLNFQLIEKLMIGEFWNALNRRKLVKNEEVDKSIAMTLDRLKELRETRRI